MKGSNELYRIDVKLSSQASFGDRREFARERKGANLQNYVSAGIFRYVDMRNKVVDNARRGHYAHKDPQQGQEPESPALAAGPNAYNGPS